MIQKFYRVDYNIEGEEKALFFTVTGQSEASEKTVFPIPTIDLNNNKINKVTWVYRAASERASNIDPHVLIDKVELQITDTDNKRLYDSGNLPAHTQEHVLASEEISWSSVKNIVLAYDDVYGNHKCAAAKWQ